MKGQNASHLSSSAAQAPAALPPCEDLLASRPGLICNTAWTNPALPAAMAYLNTEQPIEPAASMLPAPVPVQVPEGMDAATVVMPMTCSMPLSSSSTSSAAASPMPPSAEDQQLEQLLAQMLMGMDAVRPAAAWPTIHEGSDTPICYQPAIPAEVEEAALAAAAAAAAVRGPACDDLVHPLSPVDATKKEDVEEWAPNSPARPVCFAPTFAVEQKDEETGGEPPPPVAPSADAPAARVADETPAEGIGPGTLDHQREDCEEADAPQEAPAEEQSLVAQDSSMLNTNAHDVASAAVDASPHSASTESVYVTSPAPLPQLLDSLDLPVAEEEAPPLDADAIPMQRALTPMCHQPAIPGEVENAALAVCFASAVAVEHKEEEEQAGEPPPIVVASESSAMHLPVVAAASAAPGAINADEERTDGGPSSSEKELEDCEEADAPQEESALLQSLVALDSTIGLNGSAPDEPPAAAASPHSASTESVYATSPAPATDAESTCGSEATEQQLMELEQHTYRPTVRFQLPTEADMHSDVGSEGDTEHAPSAVASAVQEAGLLALRGLLLVMLALLTAASWVWTWLLALW